MNQNQLTNQRAKPTGPVPRATEAPDLHELMRYGVNRINQYEVIQETIYDKATYASAGQTEITLFQNPKGQGGKTIDDTNMTLAGNLPKPIYYLIKSIALEFYPGVSPVTVANSAADTSAVVSNFTNDVYTFIKNGSLVLNIGSKDYLIEAPLGQFPPKTKLETEFAAALKGASAAAEHENQIIMDYAAPAGRPYLLAVPLLLEPNQDFAVTLKWNGGAVALPSGQDAEIFCRLDGFRYRESQ